MAATRHRDLRESYQAIGGDLIVRVGDTVKVLRELVDGLKTNHPTDKPRKPAKSVKSKDIEEALAEFQCHWSFNDIIAPHDLLSLNQRFQKTLPNLEKL